MLPVPRGVGGWENTEEESEQRPLTFLLTVSRQSYNMWFNVFHLYQFFDIISFLMEKPCGKELLYNRCAPHSLIIFLSFNVVYFDPPIISINLRGYNTCKTVMFFCIVFAKSFIRISKRSF